MLPDPLGIYVHVPFCSAICNYCNFNRALHDEALRHRYVDAVVAHIAREGDGAIADTVYFGGGTPSLLSPGEVGRIRPVRRIVCWQPIAKSPSRPIRSVVPCVCAGGAHQVNRIGLGVGRFAMTNCAASVACTRSRGRRRYARSATPVSTTSAST
jgi:hypothetical protein